jgi:hypothetical protein
MRQQLEQLKDAREQYQRAEREKERAYDDWILGDPVTRKAYGEAEERWEQVTKLTRKLTPRFWSMFNDDSDDDIFSREDRDRIDRIRLVRYVPASDSHPTEDASYALGRYVERQDTIRSDIELDLPDAHIESHRAACYLCQEDFQEHRTLSLLGPVFSVHAVESPNADDKGTPDTLRQLPCSHVFHVSSLFSGKDILTFIIIWHRNLALIHGCSRNHLNVPCVGGRSSLTFLR